MEVPLVSVCVITYQHVNFIKKCLDGLLLQQTVFPFEIIIGEDESKDGTREICKEYFEKYPNKILLFLRSRKDVVYVNGNPTGRYNFMECIKSAKGKYIAICEGDDYWTDPLKLQKQVDFLESNPIYAICFHRVYELEGGKQAEGHVLSNLNNSEKEATYTIEDLAERNFIHTPSVVFRNELIKELPSWFKATPVGDYVLYMLISKHGMIKYLPEPMAVYRRHTTSFWSSKPKTQMLENWSIVLEYLIPEFANNVRSILEKQQFDTLLYLAELYRENKEESKYISTLSKALRLNNSVAENWLIQNHLPLLKLLKEREEIPKGVGSSFKYLIGQIKNRLR